MTRRVLVVLLVAMVGLLGAPARANAAYVFGPWTVTSPPLPDARPAPVPAVRDTSCLFEDECILVGDYGSNHGHIGFITTLTGSSTVTIPAPLPPDAYPLHVPVELSAIDCVAGVGCVATGSYPLSNNHDRVLIETRGVTGGWTASTLPDAPDGDSVSLDQIACNVDRCVAGGYAAGSFSQYPEHPQLPLLYERDNTVAGAPWVKAVGVGPVAAGTGSISHVACPPHGYCVATGGTSLGGLPYAEILVEQTDGWHAAVTPPPAGTTTLGVGGLSCWAPGDCATFGLVVADSNTGRTELASFELIGGLLQPTRIVELPTGIGLEYLDVSGLSCVPSGVCVGTGAYDWGPFGVLGALLIERDATSGDWTANPAPLPASSEAAYGRLFGVSCVTSGFCVAVGWWGTWTAGARPLVEVRTTGGWEPRGLDLPLPRSTLFMSYLDHVSCVGTRCAAGGDAGFAPYSPDVILMARSTTLTG